MMQSMIAMTVSIALAAAVIAPGSVTGSNNQVGVAGNYSSYVFAIGWSPYFCATQPSGSAECSSIPGSWAASNLALHGLWPQYEVMQDGTEAWPQFCGKSNNAAHFKGDWEQYAPGYAYDTLFTHEWQRHGSCFSDEMLSVKSTDAAAAQQVRYFGNQLALMKAVETPALLPNAASDGSQVALSDLLEAFGGGVNMTAVSCGSLNGKTYLDTVFLCYNKDADGNPADRIMCPAIVMESSYDDDCAMSPKTAKFYVYPGN